MRFLSLMMLALILFPGTAISDDVAVPEAAEMAEQPAPEKEDIPPEPEAKVFIDDYLPEGAVTRGTWQWDSSLKYSGERSHTEAAAKGVAEHSFTAKPVTVPEDYLIEQHVYIDPDNVPGGILIRFSYEADGEQNEIGIYREGEEEVFVFNDDEPVIYDGVIPKPGKWTKIIIDPYDLGLSGAKIKGLSFAVYGGKAYWDLTQFVPAKKLEDEKMYF